MIIKTPRPWWRACIDLTVTTSAWLLFAYWFIDGLYELLQQSAHAGLGSAFFDEFFPSVRTIIVYTIVGGVNASLLFGWALSNRVRFRGKDRRKPIDQVSDDTLARHFGLTLTQLQRLRSTRVVDITHSLDGGIERIDPTRLEPHAWHEARQAAE